MALRNQPPDKALQGAATAALRLPSRPPERRVGQFLVHPNERLQCGCIVSKAVDRTPSGVMISASRELLERAYAAFNARDIDAALATMDANVVWPNGMEGGNVYGHSEVRAYWLRQWAKIDPHVVPLGFEPDETGRIVVRVHQVIRNLVGEVLKDQIVHHIYTVGGGRIKSMAISTP